MVTTSELRSQTSSVKPALNIRESKIIHKSTILHHLARFVTEETVAFLFKIKPEQIERIECWQYVVYVHGVGVSCFVSYADFPPIVAADAPTPKDFVRWRKRWKSKFAPQFWAEFYADKFRYSFCGTQLLGWGKLVALIKAALSEAGLTQLREVYAMQKLYFDFGAIA